MSLVRIKMLNCLHQRHGVSLSVCRPKMHKPRLNAGSLPYRYQVAGSGSCLLLEGKVG